MDFGLRTDGIGRRAVDHLICAGSQDRECHRYQNKVEGVVGSKSHTISKGTDVFSNEVVRTGDASVADLQFIDETTMSIGPISEIRLDKFVYDPNGTSGAVVIEATRGAFRFVTGKQDQKVYQIKTPYGTLGIRG